MVNSRLEQKVFLALLLVVSVAFGWILLPFYGAVFWAVILAIIFAPIQRRLLARLNARRNLAALATLFICLLVAVLPVILIAGVLVQEGTTLYKQIESGEIDIDSFVSHAKELLPASWQAQMQRFGLGDMDQIRERLASSALQGSQFLATKAFSFGQGTFQFMLSFFLMLYLLFFLLRDGRELVARIRKAVPLSDNQKRRLFSKFTRVVRATVKGNIVVAATQGALGGIIFAILGIPSAVLCGVLMAFLSLLPAVGAGVIWTPVAIYFLMKGLIVQGVILILYGVLVIGLVDNILRPILVGKDTKMPDYVVLISTLGGLSLFGLNGFVIGPLIAALFISAWGLFTSPGNENAA
ncbi:AI-2E family transporter [Stutzerimonas xanthomarina]|uniref:AI-2E family transporter n=1 Tax=Stutzerimonas nitrititolerans TaxID=2482751 RepID=A0ABX9UVX0_9GAMM|nr:AI-2E family transporter [Stutzerimonas nitrititolerans]MBA1184277.1 AI-2E family transporter [Stutzerimonas stutzeri]OCX22478.1 AI-2E family transporter [Stutzerimonas xanthomarina]HCL75541.1 AI-2E family transporter [Pseudomonas sp.]NNT92717.1 AI-2E family transporter [Stutzerimonas nitrititolerans]RMH97545.1 AI-2E family transporter [Stutzerimonas nitrititolerans]